MNIIKAEIDKSEYGYDDFLNYRIDNVWIDEFLDEIYPNQELKGIVPTLSDGVYNPKEFDIVWNRILPPIHEKRICPILMCPDDNDFSCTLIVAEIENRGNIILWNKLGLDKTTDTDPKQVGSTVDWFDKVDPFTFSIEDYNQMLESFKQHYFLDKQTYKNNK